MGTLDAFFAWAPAWMPWTMLLGCSFGATICLAILFAQSNSETKKAHKKSAGKIDPSDLGTIVFEGVFLQIVFAIGGLLALALAFIAVYKLTDYLDFWGFVKLLFFVVLTVVGTLFWFIKLKDPRPNGGGHGHGGH